MTRDWWVRRVTFPLLERVAGRRMWTHANRLRQLQWESPARIRARMETRLRSVLKTAAEVPHYRDVFRHAGIDPSDVRSIADLAGVPLTTKADLRAGFPARTTVPGVPASRRRLMRTSGSTGVPFEFYWDRAAADELFGGSLSCLEWAGVGLWTPHVAVAVPATFATNAERPSTTRRLARRLLFGEEVVRLSALDVSPGDFDAIVGRFGDRGYFIRGYPSAVGHLAARFAAEGRPPRPYPAVVITYAETLTAANAAHIGEVFGCRVVNNYTSWDVPLMAQTCPDNPAVLHVNTDRVVVRVVGPDGRDAAVGETGRVVVTDLANHVMPFVNYAIGDSAALAAACPCGRGWPALARVEGRDSEVIVTPAGQRVSGGTLGHYLTFVADVIPYVWEYQAVQTAADAVSLRVVPTARFTESAARALQLRLEEFFGTGMSVRVEVVDQIATEASGKRLIVKPLAR